MQFLLGFAGSGIEVVGVLKCSLHVLNDLQELPVDLLEFTWIG